MDQRRKRPGILDNVPAYNAVPGYLGAFADAMRGDSVGNQLNSINAQQTQDGYRRFQLEQQEQQQQAAQARSAAQAAESRRRFEMQHGLARERLNMARSQMAAGPKPTAMQQNFEFARRNGFKGSFMDYMAAKRPQTNINMTGENAYDKEMGKQLATEYRELQGGAVKARRALNNLQVMQRAVNDPNLYTGFGGELALNMKKIAQSFGVNVKGVGTGELVSRITKEIAVGNKDNLPGPMSDSDRRFLVDMAPGLSQSPDGNRMIIELGMLSKQYEVARAQAARQYAASNGGRLDSGFYSKLSEVDAVYGDQFGNLMSKLRSVAPTAPKSVDAGFPTARNPKTGERIIFRDGQWMPAQ